MIYICVQSKINSLEEHTADDGSRVEYDYHAVQRGTLQHEIFENNSIEVWDIDESIELKINFLRE